jgi:NadR type nicotinamide-nucleotide adenylyltransferase
MSKRFQTGLVVGKFAPLHRGHALVIDHARELCEHVVLISYCNPEFERFPPLLRERWMADCFPDASRLVVTAAALSRWLPTSRLAISVPPNDAPDDVHRNFVALLCTHVLRRRVDAVFTSEGYGPGFAQVLTERFATADLGSAPVAHIEVDRNRTVVPMSGTLLRANLWAYWSYLPENVASTLVRRVVFLGGESSGKSTLSAALAQEFATVNVAEYGRELWDQKSGALEFDDMVRIAREQIRREDAAGASARAFVFCDTSALTTLFYSQEMFSRADPELVRTAARRYDVTVLCAADFPHVQDGTRRDPAFAVRQQDWYESELRARAIPYIIARGSLSDRIQAVRTALDTQC